MNGERYMRPQEEKALAKKQAATNDVTNWEDIAADLPEIPELAQEFKELKEIIKDAEARCVEISPMLEAAVIQGGRKSLACGNIKITQVPHGGVPRIMPERIVEKGSSFGLTVEQITELLEYATVRKPFTYPLVSYIPTGVTIDE